MERQFKTAKGLEVSLRYRWSIDDGINEGWIVHAIDASIDGDPAGYIKVSYVPKAEQERLFPTPFAYAIERTGSFLRIRHLLKQLPESNWAREDLLTAIEDSYRYVGPQIYDEVWQMDEVALWQRWQERKQFLNDEYRRQFREFVDFHVDKPIVDFIRVYGSEDTRYYRGSDLKRQPAGDLDFRRQGIGTLLYEAAAVWMSEHGMQLWASGVQSPDAERAWEKLAGIYDLGSAPAPRSSSRKHRRYLDGSQIRLGIEKELPLQLSDLGESEPALTDAEQAIEMPLSVQG